MLMVAQLGADIVLADSVSLENLNVSENDIIEKISDRTKAIVIVHFGGILSSLIASKR